MCTIWKNTTRSKLLKPVSAILEKTLLLPFVIPNGLWLPTPDVYRSGNVFSRFLFHASVSLMVQEVAEQQHLVLCHFPSWLTFLFKNPSCNEFRRTDEYNWLSVWEVRTMVVKALSVAWKEILANPSRWWFVRSKSLDWACLLMAVKIHKIMRFQGGCTLASQMGWFWVEGHICCFCFPKRFSKHLSFFVASQGNNS